MPLTYLGLLAATTSTTNTAAYTFPEQQYVAGRLYLLVVSSDQTAGVSPSSITGGGLTWTKITEQSTNIGEMLSVWRCIPAADAYTTLTITHASSRDNVAISLYGFDAIDATTPASGAVTAQTTTAATTITVSLAGAPSATQGTFTCVVSTATNDAPDSGWTAATAQTGEGHTHRAAYSPVGSAQQDVVWTGTSTVKAAIILAINEGASTGVSEAREMQVVGEVLAAGGGEAQISQVTGAALITIQDEARVTGLAIEVLIAPNAEAKVSGVAIEYLVKYAPVAPTSTRRIRPVFAGI